MKLKNQLAGQTTSWKLWYGLLVSLIIVVPSFMFLFIPESGFMTTISPIVQMLLLPILAVGLVWLLQWKKPSRSDLGLDKGLTKSSSIIILVVFVVTHTLFYLLSKMSGVHSDPAELFRTIFSGGFSDQLVVIISGVILAPVCEEIVYRAVMLRSFHDGLTRWFKKSDSLFSAPAMLAMTFTAIAFILPHISNFEMTMVAAYFVTSVGFSVVYLITRSLTAAMVSHSLQSLYAFGGIILFGKGDVVLSPIIYIILFGCPIIVYGVAQLLRRIY